MYKKGIVFMVLLWQVIAFGQEPYSINITRKDGLPTTNIYNSFQDRDGYMWFATDMGVLRYNGFTFTQYNSDDGLSDNEVFSFHQDAAGRIWFATYNGKLSYFYNNKFYNETNDKLLKADKKFGMILNISSDSQGRTCVIYMKGAFVVDHKSSKSYYIFSRYNGTVFDIIQSRGRDLMLTSGGIFQMDYKLAIGYPEGLTKHRAVIFRVLQHGNLTYLAVSGTIYAFDGNKLYTITDLKLSDNEIINLFIDSDSQLWIGTRNGLYRKNLLDNNSKPEYFFKGNVVSGVTEDFEKNLWISTLNNGVYFVPQKNTVSLTDSQHNQLSINCLSKKGTTLWAGSTDDKYYIFDHDKIDTYSVKAKRPKNLIKRIVHFPSQTIVIGTHSIQAVASGKVRNYAITGIKSIAQHGGNWWVGGASLLKIDPAAYEDALLNNIPIDFDPRTKIASATYALLREDGHFWAANKYGLYTIVDDNPIYISDKYPITQTTLSELYYDKNNNNLIAASNSKGLFIFQNDQYKHHLSSKNGLTSNFIYSIKKGFADNSILVGNNFGLDMLTWDGKNYTIKNLNSAIGIQNIKINDTEIIGDTLYIASDGGLLALQYDKLKPNTIAPKIKIENFEVKGKKINLRKNSVFNYDENDITIDFIGLSYNSQKNITYKYKLSGHDDHWTITKSSEINYKALRSGRYEFVVFSINAAGISSKPASIVFMIEEPFWETWSFIILSGAALLLIIYLIWRKRLKTVKAKFERERKSIQNERDKANLEKQMIELEQKALLMQMNPHFIFNALNTIKGYYSEGNDEKAGNYISKFSKLLRMLLENTEQFNPLSNEIEMLRLYVDLTKIRYRNSFEYQIQVDNQIHADEIAIPTFLLQPIVENAIIHGLGPKKQGGLLIISFQRKNGMLVCEVTDNGIGRKAAAESQKHKQHESKAIDITKERIAFLETEENGTRGGAEQGKAKPQFIIEDLYDENNHAAGTSVILTIPLKNIW
jgi:sensor histidine kinase YesM/ligand-binding sensor domain-containing protein